MNAAYRATSLPGLHFSRVWGAFLVGMRHASGSGIANDRYLVK